MTESRRKWDFPFYSRMFCNFSDSFCKGAILRQRGIERQCFVATEAFLGQERLTMLSFFVVPVIFFPF